MCKKNNLNNYMEMIQSCKDTETSEIQGEIDDLDEIDIDDELDLYHNIFSSKEDVLLNDEEEKYSWREKYIFDYKLNPEDYETEEEYLEVLEIEQSNKNVCEFDFIKNSSKKKQASINNLKIYKYCKVIIKSFNRQYDYLCGDLDINVNDSVLIPFGNQNDNLEGKVVAVGKCLECAFNTSIDNMKYVLQVLNRYENSIERPINKTNDSVVYEDECIKISFVKWEYRDYLVGGRARTGTFIFENKLDLRFCIYFKDISIAGFLNQSESHSVALSGKQKEIKDIIFAYDNKVLDCYKGYKSIEFKVCYGTIKDGYNVISMINKPIIESGIISIKI